MQMELVAACESEKEHSKTLRDFVPEPDIVAVAIVF
jgi:hypothetical protein